MDVLADRGSSDDVDLYFSGGGLGRQRPPGRPAGGGGPSQGAERVDRPACARLRARAGIGQAGRGLKNVFRRGILADDRHWRPEAVRREPGAGGHPQVAGSQSPRRGARPERRTAYIGPLQSNKAREAVENFDVIETVDRERIAAALAREIQKTANRRGFLSRSTPAASRKRPASRPRRRTRSWRCAATAMASASRG